MATTRYRNKTTGKIATYSKMIPRLEKSKNWERVTEAKGEAKPRPKSEGKSDG